MSNAHDKREGPDPEDDPWDIFEQDCDVMEHEPERGDFWGEPDDDFDNAS
jgi:hypothetical protein